MYARLDWDKLLVGVALPGIKIGWELAGGGCRDAQNIEGRRRSSCKRYIDPGCDALLTNGRQVSRMTTHEY